jgi:hypothetical protein
MAFRIPTFIAFLLLSPGIVPEVSAATRSASKRVIDRRIPTATQQPAGNVARARMQG